MILARLFDVIFLHFFFFFKQKTSYEMRISDWSSDVCSSDLGAGATVRDATKRGGHSRRLPAAAPCHGGWHASFVLSPCTRSGKREGAQAGHRNRAGQAHYGVDRKSVV